MVQFIHVDRRKRWKENPRVVPTTMPSPAPLFFPVPMRYYKLLSMFLFALGHASLITPVSLPTQPGTVPTQDLHRSDVFIAGADGYHTYRIPSLIVTTKGTVLAFCEGRKRGRGDAGDIDL